MANIEAAGAVVTRPGGEVLLVHRPKYDDWSFPKGKLDADEPAAVAAVREVAEETGLRVRLGPPLADQRYPVGAGTKVVHYWTGRVLGEDDVAGYRRADEIDRVAWVSHREAMGLLSYQRDRVSLVEAAACPPRTHALLVIRHAQALGRRSWAAADRLRPLSARGADQAQRLVRLLAAYHPRRLVSSSSVRCTTTLAPYSARSDRELRTTDVLSEGGADPEAIHRLVAELLEKADAAAICSHRPVLPLVLAAAGLEPVALDPAETLVLHHRHGQAVAVERHRL